MPQEIVIQLRKDIAVELNEQRTSFSAARTVLRLASELNVELFPQTTQTTQTEDEELSTFYSIMVSDDVSAQPIADRFAECQGVSAAYVKPMGEPP